LAASFIAKLLLDIALVLISQNFFVEFQLFDRLFNFHHPDVERCPVSISGGLVWNGCDVFTKISEISRMLLP
jgi:hypothetical protein